MNQTAINYGQVLLELAVPEKTLSRRTDLGSSLPCGRR